MPYRVPIKYGDRVALAPHLDLWMQGMRFGEVEEIVANSEGGKNYLIRYGHDEDHYAWLAGEDLLGAV